MKKTWFITGASRGFGRIWAEAALKRGDRVTATARKLTDVADLAERFGDAVLPLALDVTDSAQVQQVVPQAYAHFGRLDVLQQCRSEPLRGNGGSERRADSRPLRCELLRHGSSAPSGPAFVAETRERSHSRRLQRAWDSGITAHRLLFRHEMGS